MTRNENEIGTVIGLIGMVNYREVNYALRESGCSLDDTGCSDIDDGICGVRG